MRAVVVAGWTLLFLSSWVAIAASNPDARRCDELAASPLDTTRPPDVIGVSFDKLDADAADAAIPACERALAATPDDPRIKFQLARALQRAKRELPRAAQLYSDAADNGHALAMHNLAHFYLRGWGVERDVDRARDLIERSAGLGNPLAMHALAGLYALGQDVQQDLNKARYWYEKAASVGEARSMRALGDIYEKGSGMPKNPEKAREWQEKAASAGHVDAMINLANYYMLGFGVSKDLEKSREWLEKAVALGSARAMVGLGQHYALGLGVPQNYGTAREWYEKAALQGDRIAMQFLGEMYALGRGVAKDEAKARGWYQRAVGVDAKATPNLPDATQTLASSGSNGPDAIARALFTDAVRKCWKMPRDMESVKVEIYLKPDGELAEPPRVVSTGKGSAFAKSAGAAIQAVTSCAPYTGLPKENYTGGWERMLIVFTGHM